MRSVTTAVCFVLVMAASVPADARCGRGHSGFGMHGSGGRAGGAEAFSRDRRHANDENVKAASEERDRLLDRKLKSICRGC